jgi:hypothetical protein
MTVSTLSNTLSNLTGQSDAKPSVDGKDSLIDKKPTKIEYDGVSVYIGAPALSTKAEQSDPAITPALITATGSILSSAAWPIGLVVIALTFKRQIAALIGRIKSFKGPGGFEITTDELFAELPQPATSDDVVVDETVREVVRLSPIDAVVTSWVEVERAIARLYDRINGTSTASGNLTSLRKLDFLARSHTLPWNVVTEIRLLKEIRNRVVHQADDSLDEEAVRTYVANASSIVKSIDSVI